MTLSRPLLQTESFVSCNSGETQSRSPGRSAGRGMLSTRSGLGSGPGAAEHNAEHKEGFVSLLEMSVLKTGAPLVLSFTPHTLTAVTNLFYSFLDLLSTGQGFKGFSCIKPTFESFLKSLLSKEKAKLSPVPTAWLMLTQSHNTPPISASSAFCWQSYLMTTCLCREHLEYVDLGIFLLVFII